MSTIEMCSFNQFILHTLNSSKDRSFANQIYNYIMQYTTRLLS